jgi:hypothetical protein
MSGMTGLLECSVSSTTGGREWRVRGGCLILLRCLCPPQYGSSTLAVHTALIGISLTLILSAVSAFADTFVSGTITSNTTWTTNGSPYVVTSTPTVPSPWELTIRPGVVVESYANVMMVINGRLEARGDLDTPICFTNHPPQAHGGGILFLGGNHTQQATCSLERCTLSNMYCLRPSVYPSVNAVIWSRYAALSVSNCTFRNFSSDAIRPTYSRVSIVGNEITEIREAINLVRSTGTVASNKISYVHGHNDGVDVDYAWSGPGSPAIVIEGNSISFGIDDPYDPNSVDAMDLGSSSTNVLICANSINSFTDKGISIGESSHPVVRNNVIWDCNMGMGIKDGSSPILDNNTIIECDSGIELFRKSSGPADVVLLNSIIWNCGEGIVLLDGSTISVG